jgi:hypothetical protein
MNLIWWITSIQQAIVVDVKFVNLLLNLNQQLEAAYLKRAVSADIDKLQLILITS